MENKLVERKAGRPRALSPEKAEEVLFLYSSGLGYRAISRELEKQGLVVDWSTVRRVIKENKNSPSYLKMKNSNTILTLGEKKKSSNWPHNRKMI